MRRPRLLFTAALVAMLVAGCGLLPEPDPDLELPDKGPTPPAPTHTRLWSNAALWPGGELPTAGSVVEIPSGETVLLDISPPPLAGLLLNGNLVFDEQDLELTSDWIMIHGGLYVGSSAEPFDHNATITLTGDPTGGHVLGMNMGEKLIGIMGGVLQLYGSFAGNSWTRLAQHGNQGDLSITVQDASGWKVGDAIVIATTDYEQWTGSDGNQDRRDIQVEQRVITAVAGNVLTLDDELDFDHFGQTQSIYGVVVDQRAEVANLTRNIVVQSEADTRQSGSTNFRFGGHVMGMAGAHMRIHGVEFRRMGQLGVMGRYPVHFHLLAGEGQHSYISGSSVHHSFSRCVAIHGSHQVKVTDVAAFDSYGHCFFLEDGSEVDNQLHRNLALMIRKPPEAQTLIASDRHFLGPAAFWVTNPDNVLVGNVAASSQGTGFWYALPLHPTAISFTTFDGPNIWPRRTPLGEFRQNVAHSNASNGLHVDNGPSSDASGVLTGIETVSYRPRSEPNPNGNSSEPVNGPVTAYFDDFNAYRHRNGGAWFRGDYTVLRGGVLSDNAVGVTFASRISWAEDVAFIGETNNLGTPRNWETTGLDGRSLPRPWQADFAIRGYEFYDGDVGVRGSSFANFTSNAQRPASALAYLNFTAFPTSPRNFAEDLSFQGGTNRVYLATRQPTDESPADGYRSAIFRDVTGSVTGASGRVVTPNNPFLTTGACSLIADWNAYSCSGQYASLSLDAVDGPQAALAPVTITRSDGQSHVMLGTPNNRTYYRTMLRLDQGPYDYSFAGGVDHLRLNLQDLAEDAAVSMIVSLPYAGSAPYVYRDWWINNNNLVQSYGSLAALQAAAGPGLFHDGTTLHLKLVKAQNRDYAEFEICRQQLCGD